MYAVEIIAFFIGLVIFLIIVLLPTPIIRIFNSEVETVATASKVLRFFAVFGFVAAPGYPFRIIFNRNGWGRYVLYIETSTNVIFILGLTLLLTKILRSRFLKRSCIKVISSKDKDIFEHFKRHNSSFVLKELGDAILFNEPGNNVCDLSLIIVTD